MTGTGIALTGLASGLDTDTMVTQLMAIERQKLTRITYRQTNATAHKTGLTGVAGKLSALKDAADALKSTANATWTQSQTVESSDASKVAATQISGTGIGGHTIEVDRLASSAQHGYAFTPSATAGSLTIFAGSDPNAAGIAKVTVSVQADATAADIATAINAAAKSPVSAAVITDATTGAERLVLSSRTTGSGGDFTVDASGLTAGQLSEDATYARTGGGLDAQYRVDGSSTVLTSTSNTVENAIPGVRLTLKGVTSAPVTVTTSAPDVDRDAVTTKIKAFVDAYNSLIDDVTGKVSEKPVSSPASTSDAQKGALYGDSGLTSMLSQLRDFMSQTLSGLTGVDDLSDLGISVPKATGGATSDDAKLGKLSIDDDALKQALDADWTQVSDFFTSFAGKLDTFVKGYTGTSKSIIDGRLKSDDATVGMYDDQIARMNDRLDAEETRLRTQFAAMESALSQAQAQQSWLTGQLNQLAAKSG